MIIHSYDQRYYINDGNFLTYNVSVKLCNLSMVLYVYATIGSRLRWLCMSKFHFLLKNVCNKDDFKSLALSKSLISFVFIYSKIWRPNLSCYIYFLIGNESST